MNMTLTDAALRWFQREFGLREGDAMRFYAKYGGGSSFHPGFSIGIRAESPKYVGASCTKAGITFFICEDDLWMFEGKSLCIGYDPANDDIVYQIIDSDECIRTL